MIVRITKESDGRATIIHIEGWHRSEVEPESEKECQAVDGRLVLDLSQFLATDRTEIKAIRDPVSKGVELRGASRCMQLLLSDERS